MILRKLKNLFQILESKDPGLNGQKSPEITSGPNEMSILQVCHKMLIRIKTEFLVPGLIVLYSLSSISSVLNGC